MFDFTHPFYRPYWRRIAIVLFCLAFSAVEFIFGSPLFGAIFVAIGLFVVWKLFLDKKTVAALNADQAPSDQNSDELK